MKRSSQISLILSAIALVAIAAYLNRAYALVYSRFDQLKQPETVNMAVEKKARNIRYAALGDSLTYGVGAENTGQSFPAIVAGKLTGNQTSVELSDLAAPGAVSQQVLDNQLPEAIKFQPDIVTVLIGVNDLHNFVPLDDYRANIDLILKELAAKTKAKVYVINLPYLGANDLILPPYRLYFSSQTDRYNRALTAAAAAAQVAVVDIHSTKEQFLSDPSLYSADAFHPSAKGYGIWANIVYDAIK